MGWFKKPSKTEQAASHASSALSGFDAAKASLAKAIDLLDADATEHDESALFHKELATYARTEAARHARVHARLTDLTS